MGKTVWLDKFCSDPGEGLVAAKVDYEGVRTSEEFLLRTVRSMRGFASRSRRGKEALGAFFDGLELSAGPVTVKPAVSHRSPTQLLEIMAASVAGALAEGQLLVVAMDEVPIAIDNIASEEGSDAASRLLQALRSARREHASLRWIVCGSIGFHHVLRRCGITEGVLNDLVNLPLGPFSDQDALELAHRLALGIDRPATPEVAALLARTAGNIPFLIHALAHRLEETGRGDLTPDDVQTAFDDFVHDRDASRAVTHLVTRLDLYDERAAHAGELLDRAAVADAPVPEKGLSPAHRAVVDDLVDDHYLARTSEGLRWRYDVLRQIWVVRRGLA